MTVSELVKGTTSVFNCYRDGELWYDIMKVMGKKEEVDVDARAIYEYDDVQKVFSFPIPISDTGTGIFPARMKSIIVMRWIRKQGERELSYTAEKQLLKNQ